MLYPELEDEPLETVTPMMYYYYFIHNTENLDGSEANDLHAN
jgi:hypothetical protein